MPGACEQKLPQLFISHRAIIAAADTMRSTHQVPAERNNIVLHARDLKLDSSFHPATVCLRSLTAQRRFSRPALSVVVPAADDEGPHFHGFTSERHLIISLYLSFSAGQSVPVSAVDSIICRSHTDALALFPQQRALRKCQVGLFTCPLLPLALLL